MKSLKQIYVEYEIHEIYPENLPDEIRKILNQKNTNPFLVGITAMLKPTRREIHDTFELAFDIFDENRLNNYEKLEFLIDRFFDDQINADSLLERIRLLNLDYVTTTIDFEDFRQCLFNFSSDNWIPGDHWEWVVEKIIKEFKYENKYSELLFGNWR